MKVTVIIPCYNEETNLQKGVLDKIGNYISQNQSIQEVIIVDDGSSDLSKEIIRTRYLPLYSHFRLIENPHSGKASAVITGISQARTPYVFFMDMDLATPIEETEKLFELAQTFPIVIGSRNNDRKGAPFVRKIMAVGMIFVRNFIIGLKGIKDTQCGFKFFDRTVALDVLKHLYVFKKSHSVQGSSVSAAFDLEFLFVAQKRGYKISEVPVHWRHVETKNVNFIKDSIESLRDILKIKIADISGKYST